MILGSTVLDLGVTYRQVRGLTSCRLNNAKTSDLHNAHVVIAVVSYGSTMLNLLTLFVFALRRTPPATRPSKPSALTLDFHRRCDARQHALYSIHVILNFRARADAQAPASQTSQHLPPSTSFAPSPSSRYPSSAQTWTSPEWSGPSNR